MIKKTIPDDFTGNELRSRLVEKQCADRRKRLEYFRRTGRLFFDTHKTQLFERVKPAAKPDHTQSNNAINSAVQRRKIVDNLLLSIEIIAILGLLFIAYSGFSLLRDLNQEMASAMTQPTLTTTPLVSTIILPSGHTPPNSPGGAQPIEPEIPEDLRPLMQSITSAPIPTPAPQHATRIQIPSIGIDAPIVQGDSWEQLKKGVGQHIGSANPGDDSNVVLSAHNDIYGEIFRHLDRLNSGDQVIIHTEKSSYTYLVSQTQIVDPQRIEVLEPTNYPIVTLISCYPYLINNKRIVVTAYMQSETH